MSQRAAKAWGVLAVTVESAVFAFVAIIGRHFGERLEADRCSRLLRQHGEERQTQNKCEHQDLLSPHHGHCLSMSILNSEVTCQIQSIRHSNRAKSSVRLASDVHWLCRARQTRIARISLLTISRQLQIARPA